MATIRTLTVPTCLSDAALLEAARHLVGCSTTSAYTLRCTATPATRALNPTDPEAAPITITCTTLQGTTPVPDQPITVTIARENGTHTVTLTTNAEGVATLPLWTAHAQTMTVQATWRAPDGLHHASATATWTASQPTTGGGSTPGGGSRAGGSGSSGLTPPTLPTPLARISGETIFESFRFTLTCTGPQGQAAVPFLLDTGAFEMLLTQAVADQLGLPDLGTIEIQGVTGSASAYQSRVTVQLGTTTWTDVACIVDPSFSTNLFGFRFWQTRALEFLLQPQAQVLWVFPEG